MLCYVLVRDWRSMGQPMRRTLADIVQLVEGFEACTLTPLEFDHQAHMTVALWYLSRLPDAEASERMRAGIRRFAAVHRKEGLYNETVTLFWMKLLRHVLDTAPPRPLAEFADHAIETWGRMDVLFGYYSRDVAFSERAKAAWVEPDRRPIDF
jgi:hypothetical protein